VQALKERSGWQKAVVALANKNARILWAVMTRDKPFDRHHVSVKPASPFTPLLARRQQDDALTGQPARVKSRAGPRQAQAAFRRPASGFGPAAGKLD
jgi:hypothetical protein